ncbi:Got1/Sft2-like family-domain-containing protein [Pavlovales sp. CCMP2436]|nr:Got1/Sft2-like family-domain-containing protein [Pavlovales sp. CCMP2436]|mmetsp:Transcript_35351/g.81873  ORF Transcript_35351/g.81873 Transcript_35351/m.81873 type:complete len:225 (-) Transcript_35351:176-850(-)
MAPRGWFQRAEAGLSDSDRAQPLLLDEEVARAQIPSRASFRWIFLAEQPPSQPSRLEERLWPFRRPAAAQPADQACIPNLSMRQRLVGFAACFVLGSVLSLGSISSFGSLVAGNPASFALQFSAGNLLSTLSTGFVVGFGSQLRSMSQKSRALSAAIFLSSTVATLVLTLCFQPHALVVLLCIVLQYGSMVWYIASYVPFGRSMLSGCCRAATRSLFSAWDESL